MLTMALRALHSCRRMAWMGRSLTRPGVNGDWDQAEGQQCKKRLHLLIHIILSYLWLGRQPFSVSHSAIGFL